MTRSLAEILDERDDARLCLEVNQFLFPSGARERKLRSLSRIERVVRLVWSATTTMQSGGLREVLKSGVAGDKSLKSTIKAYDAVGCPAAAQVFRKALSLFPDGQLPRDPLERMALVDSRSDQFVDLVQQFRTQQEHIQQQLARYVRGHRDGLLTGAQDIPPEAAREPASPKDLPHWARVLFAARCAKVVYPLLRIHWPMMVRPRKLAIKRAIHVAAKSAINGQVHPGTPDAIILAEQTAGAAHGGKTLTDVEPRASSGISRTIASFVAKAAEKAAYAAELSAADSMTAVDDGFRFAHCAAQAAGSTVMMEKLKRAFHQLLLSAKQAQWTDTSAVPRKMWDAL